MAPFRKVSLPALNILADLYVALYLYQLILSVMEAIIIHPQNKEQASLFEQLAKTLKVPFEKSKKKTDHYNIAFERKMRESRKQAEKGQTVKINLDEIWK